MSADLPKPVAHLRTRIAAQYPDDRVWLEVCDSWERGDDGELAKPVLTESQLREYAEAMRAELRAVMAQMYEALKFAQPFAQAEWFKCIGNAPTSDAGYEKWSVDPAVLRMKGGMDSIKSALSAYQSLGEQSAREPRQ